ncbi:MAG: DUF393 domain-containing protein [Phycisphaera sp.]|nr:DUF393 domain-containing protein [Phycisphaera sp.]
MARRRNEAVSAAIQRVEADAASRDAARFDVRGSVRQNLGGAVSDPPAVILFDGGCSLFDRTVQFVLRRDQRRRFRFAPLRGDTARRLCADAGVSLPTDGAFDSVIVIANGKVLERSDAALAIAARPPFPWPCLGVLCIVPRPLRDAAYGWVARNRYRLFGRRDTCMIPSPEHSARFLE